MSHAWKSTSFSVKAQWKRLEPNIRRMRLDRSPAMPRDLEEFVKHVAEYAKDKAEYMAQKIENAELDLEIAERTGRKPVLLFDAKRIGNGRCGVLGLTTIWSDGWTPEPGRPAVRWPDAQEFKEEGDERFTSSFGRYFPLLRYPGNETVNWKQRPRLREYPLDEVMPVPRKCPVVIPYLYGFDLEIDHAGIPFDDDEVPGGSIAIAYHLDEKNENLHNASLDKILAVQEFHRQFASQLYGEDVEESNGFDADSYATVPSTEGVDDRKGPFRFNPRASEFVSIRTTPDPEDAASPAEITNAEFAMDGVNTRATVGEPVDAWAVIKQINALAVKTYAKELGAAAAHKSNFSLSNITEKAETPGFTSGSSLAEDCDEIECGLLASGLQHSSLLKKVKTYRQGSFGAIGSERRSSGNTSSEVSEDDGESEVDGGVSLTRASFGTIIPNDSAEISPKTMPAGATQLLDLCGDMPATLAELVAESYSDEDD